MSDQPHIVAFAGSARNGSFNVRLVKVAAEGARAAGASVTVLDMRDYPMPLFDQDLEGADGPPESARRLREIMLAHEGLLIASPEYNSSVTPLLKNTIDWVSRPGEGQQALAAYQGKVAAVMSASPGRLGGLRGLVHLRSILSNIGLQLEQLPIDRWAQQPQLPGGHRRWSTGLVFPAWKARLGDLPPPAAINLFEPRPSGSRIGSRTPSPLG